VFRVLRFTRGYAWQPVQVGPNCGSWEEARQLAAGDWERAPSDCAIAIDADGEIAFTTRGFVPLDIDERIYAAVDRARAEEPKIPLSCEAYDHLNMVATQLSAHAAEERASSQALTTAAYLVRSYLAKQDPGGKPA
jgi:hypothetical protein